MLKSDLVPSMWKGWEFCAGKMLGYGGELGQILSLHPSAMRAHERDPTSHCDSAFELSEVCHQPPNEQLVQQPTADGQAQWRMPMVPALRGMRQ